jgi:two-component system chemotaxis sensor kinase CheA
MSANPLSPAEWLDLEDRLTGLAMAGALLDASSPDEAAVVAQGLAELLAGSGWDGFKDLASTAKALAEDLNGSVGAIDGTTRLQKILSAVNALVRSNLSEIHDPADAPPPEPRPNIPENSAPSPACASASDYVDLETADRQGWVDFTAEGSDLVSAIENHVMATLRGEPFEALVVLRPLHTLKGICGMLGLGGLNRLIHSCEDALQPFKSEKSLPGPQSNAVLWVCDVTRRQIETAAANINGPGFDVLPIDATLNPLLALDPQTAPPSQVAAAAPILPPSKPSDTARIADNFVRIPVAKMDSLLEAVSELAICQAQVTEGVVALDLAGPLTAEANRLAKISRQLQEVILSLRMVPVEPLFNRISRQAWDLSRDLGKNLRLELEGEKTEVDKGLVEDLFEPLLHLVRNALDHGLETPEERVAAGKPAEGLLRLSARHQGGEFVLEMSDDGHGFDLEKIAEKARGLGWIGPDEEVPADRLIAMIFEAGFSTANRVTDLSGRGVGLDAVKQRVILLKGTVSARGEKGQGATFTLRLPLTMALMEAILVRANQERYALPAGNVLKFLAWDPEKKHAVAHGAPWIEASGKSLPLVNLGSACAKGSVAMHISIAGKEACLVVDEVLGKQQVVIKGLGELLKDTPGVGGGAVLSDGRVGLILDLESLIRERSLC